jgi:hypothetical protein
MQGIQAAQLTIRGKVRGILNQPLVDLDHTERRPLPPDSGRGRSTYGQLYCTDRLHIANTTHEPSVSPIHRLAQNIATTLGYVALD